MKRCPFPHAVVGAALCLGLLSDTVPAAIYALEAPGEVPVYTSEPRGHAYRLVIQDDTPAPAAPHGRLSSPGVRPTLVHLEALAERIARRQQVDPALVRAVIEVESSFRPSAISPKGAVGVMQLMPATARRYGVADRRDPAQNIEGGVAYLKDLLARFRGNVALALAAYNAGEYTVERHGRAIPTYRETMLYVPQVLEAYARILATEHPSKHDSRP